MERMEIRTPENKDMFLPLIMAGMVELHLVQFRLRFDKNSQPELLERGGFKKFEEQGFWSELFNNYDLSLKNGRP